MDDRLHVVLDPYDQLWDQFSTRLAGLTDMEYFREPVPGCWSLRRREQSTAPRQIGRGDWALEESRVDPDPPPFTTIAWRLCHMGWVVLMRHNWTFGTRDLQLDDIEWPTVATAAIAFVTDAHQKWRGGLETVTREQLDQIGFSQVPHGSDPDDRFIEVVAWQAAEFSHHAAEVACLRDLYRTQEPA
jgi:DinB superfamily